MLATGLTLQAEIERAQAQGVLLTMQDAIEIHHNFQHFGQRTAKP